MSEKRTPLYVRLPRSHADRLDRAAFELKMSKQDLVAGLIEDRLGHEPPGFIRRETTLEIDDGLTVGRASFQPAAEREVMTLAVVAAWREVDEQAVEELVEANKIPGRNLGDQW